ncbi:MAG: hypothetical protein JWQ83_75 [Lacunisphaera sp.]|nr:hypothetical protein [Lacunisphaera sp.]
MSGPAEPRPAAPSVFLSYASENRAAARQIRDALAAAGIEAWYDENELTGGDAWDQKIRRQIRDCTYFMPVISAESNARHEGYFRREWRLAIERSLDMADDVVFLLPVVVDNTTDGGARVPEKFFTVQWLRLPGGAPTPAFHELARRLAAGGAYRLHLAPTPPRLGSSGTSRPPQYLPPIDQDPGPPKEWWRWLKYFWPKLPRFVRFCLWCVFVVSAMSLCSRISSNRPDETPRRNRATGSSPASPTAPGNYDGKAIEQTVKNALRGAMAARQALGTEGGSADLELLAFESTGEAEDIQQELFGKLVVTHGVKTRIDVTPLKGTPGDAAPVERARASGARLILSGKAAKPAEGPSVLRLKLERAADGAQLWTTDVKTNEDPETVAMRVYAEILPFLLKKD